MAESVIDGVPARPAENTYDLNEEESHIEVNQELVRRLGADPLLEHTCPTHMYSVGADGTVGVEYAACLECGICLAMVPKGVSKWYYPRGSFDIMLHGG